MSCFFPLGYEDVIKAYKDGVRTWDLMGAKGAMKNYSALLLKNLADYKSNRLPGVLNGTWSYDGIPRDYAHVLPVQDRRLNILPGMRDSFWEWFNTQPIKLHRHFHHLNSSQAMAFNAFFPLIGANGRVDTKLFAALGVEPLDACAEFEKVLDAGEDTSFDFYLHSRSAERKLFFEVKLSESEFGSAEEDSRHKEKLEKYYRPNLAGLIDPKWLEQGLFFKNYQILRNISYLGRYPDSALVFLFPRENDNLERAEKVIREVAGLALEDRVLIVHLEDFVDRLVKTLSFEEQILQEHYGEFSEKYIIAGGGKRSLHSSRASVRYEPREPL